MIFALVAAGIFLVVVLPKMISRSRRGERVTGGYDGSSYSCSTSSDSGGGHHSHSCGGGGDSSCSSSCGSSCGGGGD